MGDQNRYMVSNGQAQVKPKESVVENSHAGARDDMNSEQRLKEMVSNGDQLKLKAKFEEVINKIANSPSCSQPQVPNPRKEAATMDPPRVYDNFPPEPGEKGVAVDMIVENVRAFHELELMTTQGEGNVSNEIVNVGGAMQMDVSSVQFSS